MNKSIKFDLDLKSFNNSLKLNKLLELLINKVIFSFKSFVSLTLEFKKSIRFFILIITVFNTLYI